MTYKIYQRFKVIQYIFVDVIIKLRQMIMRDLFYNTLEQLFNVMIIIM